MSPSGWLTGFERAMLFFRDSSGYAIGLASTLANGSVSGAYVAGDVKTAGLAPINPTELNQQSGDRVKNVASYGNGKVGPFDLVLSEYDTALMTMITLSVVNTTNSKRTKGSDNPNKSRPTILGLALQQRYTVDDSEQYFTRIFPRCQMRWRQTGLGFQAESDVVIRVSPQMVTKAINGQVFGTTGLNLNLENDEADNYFVITDEPFHIVTFKSDGAASTFNTIYKPTSTVITLNATPNEFSINAVPTALTSLTLAGLATMVAAGSAADVNVLEYGTSFVPV